jgi:hypothetical protein
VEAFIAAVHALAELVIEQSTDARRLGIVATQLNALAGTHGLAQLPVPQLSHEVRCLVADLQNLGDGRLRLDVETLRSTVEKQPPSYWDLALHADDRLFVGRWEDVPDQSVPGVDFPVASPPAWLTERLP